MKHGAPTGEDESCWLLVDTTGDIVAVPQQGSTATAVGTATARCVPLDDVDGFSVRVQEPADGVVVFGGHLRNSFNDDEGYDDKAALPQATLVVTDRMMLTSDIPDAAVPGTAQRSLLLGTARVSMNGIQGGHAEAGSALSNTDDQNKKNHQVYIEHVILSTDTLSGLCLRYHISKRDLQRANGFSGDSLRLAPERLVIPITEKARRLSWQPQDKNSKQFKIAALLAQMKHLSTLEATSYLEMNDWKWDEALQEALNDEAWEREQVAERLQASKRLSHPLENSKDLVESNKINSPSPNCCFLFFYYLTLFFYFLGIVKIILSV